MATRGWSSAFVRYHQIDRQLGGYFNAVNTFGQLWFAILDVARAVADFFRDIAAAALCSF